ncbi:MAG: antitoxin [Desulfuromonas sp.]|nr:MAG: antitoxin [Desulfuromonas sp.]
MFDLMEYRQLYQKTIDRWGVEAQHDQAIEECAELITTLQHYRRQRVDEDHVADELADVFLMLGQLIHMFGEARVKAAVDRKLSKLNSLLSSSPHSETDGS